MGHRRIHLGTVAIVLFLIADVVLVGAAYRHVSHPKKVADAGSDRSFHVQSSGSAPGSSAPASSHGHSPTARTSTNKLQTALLLSDSSPLVAISANGGCHGKPHLAMTTNGGKRFAPLAAPARHVLRVESTGATEDWIIGANAKCALTYYSTVNSGRMWSASPTLGQVWVALPTGVHTPNNGLVTPCGKAAPQPLALAPSGFTVAIVVCRNGLHETSNGGTSWSAAASLPAGKPFAAALTTGGDGIVLLTNSGKCAGVQVALTASFGVTWTRGECLHAVTAPAGVALTSTGAGLVADADRSYSSTDAGKTWTRLVTG